MDRCSSGIERNEGLLETVMRACRYSVFLAKEQLLDTIQTLVHLSVTKASLEDAINGLRIGTRQQFLRNRGLGEYWAALEDDGCKEITCSSHLRHAHARKVGRWLGNRFQSSLRITVRATAEAIASVSPSEGGACGRYAYLFQLLKLLAIELYFIRDDVLALRVSGSLHSGRAE